MASAKSHSRGLLLIAAFKLLKAFALIAVGIGALRLLHKDVAGIVEHWVNAFRVDPHNHYILWLLAKLSIVDDKKLKELSIGTFIYAAIFLTEGIGLAFRKVWAEYFTIITTGGLIPLEIFELARHFTATKLAVAFVNVLIVWYLVARVRSH